MKIYVASSCNYIDSILKKLFELNYTPDNITVLSCHDLAQICDIYKIEFVKIKDNSSLNNYFSKEKYNDLFINMSGLPFRVSNDIIEKFSSKMINYHSGLTDQYRGRWSVSWALIHGKKKIGYTWHFINKDYDCGNIIYQKKFKISKNDTAFSLNHKLFNHAIANLDQVIELSQSSGCPPDTVGNYYNKTIPFDGTINPQWDPDKIDRFIRAMYYPPHAPAKCAIDGKDHYVDTYHEYLALVNKKSDFRNFGSNSEHRKI